MPSRTVHRTLLALLAAAALAACSSGGAPPASSSNSPAGSSSAADTASSGPGATESTGDVPQTEVVLVTHDSFAVDPDVLAAFESSSGLKVTQLAEESLANQLVLTKDHPLGDVAFGVDNTFASRTVDAGVFAKYRSPLAANGADSFKFDNAANLTAIDYGDVCVNVDHTWFTAKGLAEPASFEDLLKPEYKDLLVVESPATSSTGLAFLLGTIGHAGQDGWQNYWTALKDNGVKVVSDWNSAYYVDFSGSDGKGERPLVVSYASSPPAEVKEGMTEAPTGTLLDTCFRQIEYAGVLAGAKNVEGAQRVIDFMLSPEFQAGLPDGMYVYPVDTSVPLPDAWAKYAQVAANPVTVAPEDITKNRDSWIQQWSDLLG